MNRALALLLVVTAGAAQALGLLATKKPGTHHSVAADVVVLRDDQTTVLTIRRAISGPKEPVALVIPVPETIDLSRAVALGSGAVSSLVDLDAPRLEFFWERDPCEPTWGGSRGVGFAAGPRSKGLGEYRLELVAKDGLDAALGRRGLALSVAGAGAVAALPDGIGVVIAEIDPQRVVVERGVMHPSPLRLEYRASTLTLPLGFSAADEAQELVLHLVTAEGRLAATGLPIVEAPTNVDLRPAATKRFSNVYAGLLARVWAREPHAVITEFAGALTQPCNGCRPERVIGRFQLDELGFDVFAKPPPIVDPLFEITNAGQLRPEAKALLETKLDAARRHLHAVAEREASGAGLVLTRLRVRLPKAGHAELQTFNLAPPIVGGRELWRDDGLEVGAAAGTGNDFQTRFVVRHPWRGRAQCEEPVWGEWGDHPRGAEMGGGGDRHGLVDEPGLPPASAELEPLIDSAIQDLGLGTKRPAAGTSRRGKL